MTLSRAVSGPISKPISLPLMGHLLDSGISTPIIPAPVDIAPTSLNFEEWVNQPASPMDSMSGNTFTNGGTGYIHYNVGAEAGEEYVINIDQTRGAGTCLIYFAAEANVTQAGQVWGLEGGSETITLTADGPWLTFRASVGATTTTVNSLSIYKKVAVPTIDLDQMISDIIAERFSNSELGVLYVPAPVINGQQVLWQDEGGTIPVTTDGDPTGRMDDLSGNGNHAYQDSSTARPVYRTDGTLHWLEFDGVDDAMSLTTLVSSATALFAVSTEGGSLAPIISNANGIPGSATSGDHIFINNADNYSISIDGASNNTGSISIDGGALLPEDGQGGNVQYPDYMPIPQNTPFSLLVAHNEVQENTVLGYLRTGSTDIYGGMKVFGILLAEGADTSISSSTHDYFIELAARARGE